MKLPMLVAGLCIASVSSAQVHIQSSDPSAYTPDSPSRPFVTPRTPALPPSSRGPENLTNATVIALVQAGLGSEAVIAKINASTGSYDTSTDALIQLKRARVPDPVIAAMLQRSQSPVVANAVADNASPDPLIAHSPGIYLLDRRGTGRMVRIDPTVSNQMKTSGTLGFAFSYGIASMKMKTVIPNAGARIHAADRRPVFYFYFNQTGPLAGMSEFNSALNVTASSPNEFSLIRFDQKSDHREAAVGSFNIGGVKTGVSDKARVSFSYDDVAPGVFKVMPSTDLAPGEYGFVYSMTAGAGMGMVARIFDFSIS